MNEPWFVASTSSSFFDTYLVYGIIGLLVLIAIVGLIILLSTSCCCCHCCVSPSACASSCFSTRRHSSYRLRQRSKHLADATRADSKKTGFIRRHPSDVADFSQLYDSCPHLINSRAMAPPGTNMDTSCTTIDTIVSPVSPCSSFRSLVGSGTLPTDIQVPIGPDDLSKLPLPLAPHVDKTSNMPLPPPPSSSFNKDAASRPFSYIKNTNDRAQILRRLSPQERSIPANAVPLDVTRLPPPPNDETNQLHCNSTNIYETVLPTNSSLPSVKTPSPPPPPIYETEWTHSLRQLMMVSTALTNTQPSSMELPTAPPDLIPSTNEPSHYFQQQNPYDKFLAGRTSTSDSMRRTNMLRRLKDDAAFLY